MRLLYVPLLCSAIVQAVNRLNFTNDPRSGIATGEPFQLAWNGNIGAVNITLNNGTEARPKTVDVIASKISVPDYDGAQG